MNHGNIEFFTVTCLNWQPLLKVEKHKQIIFDSLAFLINDRIYQFWERRPYRARIYTRTVAEQKIDYIHFNPVKAGLCKLPEEYLFSSAQFYYLNIRNPLITHYMEHK